MLKRSQFFKAVLGITILLFSVLWLEKKTEITSYFFVAPISDDFEDGLAIEINRSSDSSDFVHQWNSNHSFPGAFNLMEEASRFTGALRHPIKEWFGMIQFL